MKTLILMMQFLTRIPLPVELKAEPADFGRGVKYFPAVGLVLGALTALIFWLLDLTLDRVLTMVLVVLFNTLITGALHLDGLADTCDGLFSVRSKERMLEIMRDSRIGTNGALAVFFALVLKLVLLCRIEDSYLLRGILLVPVISRTMMVLLIMTCPPARAESGMGNLFIGKTRWVDAIVAFTFCLAALIAGFGYRALPLLGLNLVALWLYRKMVMRKIGGMTGDTLGALNELSEVVSLLVLSQV